MAGRAAAGEDVPGELYEQVSADPAWAAFTKSERLAAEFAERYALDHRNMDDDLWDRLHAAFNRGSYLRPRGARSPF